MFKKFHDDIDSLDYDDLDNQDYNFDFSDDAEYRKIGTIIRTLFKEFDRDYYKPIRTDGAFAGINNNYIEYANKGDRYEYLLAEKYLYMIRPYLRDLINEHKPIDESNDDTDRAEWKIQLTMQNSCISTRSFAETRTLYTKSKLVELFMGSNTKMSLINFLIHLIDFSVHKKHHMNEGANLFLIVLNYHIIIFKEQTLEELNHT